MFTDSKERTWFIFERTDGSISIYYTKPGTSAHFVVFDTLDSNDPMEKNRIEAWGMCAQLTCCFAHPNGTCSNPINMTLECHEWTCPRREDGNFVQKRP